MGASDFHRLWDYAEELDGGLYSTAEVAVDDDDQGHVYVYGLVPHADLMAPLPLDAAQEMVTALQRAIAMKGVSV